MTALERVQREADKGNLGTVEKKYHKMLRGYWLDGKIYLSRNAETAIMILSGMKATYVTPIILEEGD